MVMIFSMVVQAMIPLMADKEMIHTILKKTADRMLLQMNIGLKLSDKLGMKQAGGFGSIGKAQMKKAGYYKMVVKTL